MKKIIMFVMFVGAAIICVMAGKYVAEKATGAEVENTTFATTVIEETIEVEETTTEIDFRPKTTERYEDASLYRQVGMLPSKLPFAFGYPDAVRRACMYVPTEERGDSDVWDNAYILVEHHKDYPVILKLNEADGIEIGNIVAMEQMTNANLTFVYLDGKYSQEYTMSRDGNMIILDGFPEGVKEIQIHNRSTNSIYEGEISSEKVYINDIIIKIVD